MRRLFSLLLVLGYLVLTVPARAAISPTDARAQARDAEDSLTELNYFLVDQYFHQGAFEQATVILDRIITLNPTGSDPYATAAWLLWSAQKTDDATAFIRRMLAANPDDMMANFEAGLFYVRLKNDEEAIKWLERAVKLGLPSPKRHLYGLTLARLGRTAEALAFWRQVLAEEPANTVARQQVEKLTNNERTPADEKKHE